MPNCTAFCRLFADATDCFVTLDYQIVIMKG